VRWSETRKGSPKGNEILQVKNREGLMKMLVGVSWNEEIFSTVTQEILSFHSADFSCTDVLVTLIKAYLGSNPSVALLSIG
jgi:hypothetical protein